MARNKYFNLYNNNSEQSLVDDLNREVIAIHGIDCYYLPRTLQKHDLILNEDVLSKFSKYYEIDVYVKDIDGFTGSGDLLNKFGFDIRDQMTFVLSRTKFNKIVGQDINNPKEGDLIFFPITNGIFEIKFVEHESVFYNLGERYVYELKCEKFVYSHEDIKIGIEGVDGVADEASTKNELKIVPILGDFVKGETVYQGATFDSATARAKVQQVIGMNNAILISDIFGQFSAGMIVGNKSGAMADFVSIDLIDIINPFAGNKPIDTEARKIIDFSEFNPFSEM